jgi:hypothetical protein
MPFFEPSFPKAVLFGMMQTAQADAPAVRRLERSAAIGTGADMSALNRQALATGHAAVMLTNPGAMGRA